MKNNHNNPPQGQLIKFIKFLIQVLHSLYSLNGKLEMLGFFGGKPEIPQEKNPEQGRGPKITSTSGIKTTRSHNHVR